MQTSTDLTALNVNVTASPARALEFSTLDLLAMLRNMHMQGWAYMENFGAGRKSQNIASAIAICLVETRGSAVHYFDIRASGSGWPNELNPNHWQEQHSDFCWIVAQPGIVSPEDLAPGWGLLVPRPRQKVKGGNEKIEIFDYVLDVQVQAKKRDCLAIPREFLAKLMRSATQDVEEKARSISHAKEIKLRHEFQRQVTSVENKVQRKYEELEQRVKVFAEQTGISLLNPYEVPAIATIRIAQALERIGPMGTADILAGLDKLARHLNENARLLSQTTQDIRANFAEANAAPPTQPWSLNAPGRKALSA